MLRLRPAYGIGRSLTRGSIAHRCNSTLSNGARQSQLASTTKAFVSKRPQSLALACVKPNALSLQRYIATSRSVLDQSKSKKDLGKLEAHPEAVSAVSTVTPALDFEPSKEDDIDMLAGVKSDWRAVLETFSLSEVPQQAYVIGFAGVLPYLATSLSTFYLSWDISYAATYGEGFLLSGKTAELLLHIVEPLQVGYGAVIISFLGAIHWGLEFAGYGGHQGYKRYAIGVVAPAVAWPTILMPVEYALITQFLAFTGLYFTDATLTKEGWVPHWYATYRFVLTFVVGASILISLIGRGKIEGLVDRTHGTADRIKQLTAEDWEELEQEERERQAKEAEEEDEDEEDGAAEGEDGDGEDED